MTCAHENADHLKAGEWFNLDGVPQHVVVAEQFRCIDCGAWLALGKANDRPRAVQIEIRAARIYAGFESCNDTDDTIDDPICANVLANMLGMCNLQKRAEPVSYLADAIASEGP